MLWDLALSRPELHAATLVDVAPANARDDLLERAVQAVRLIPLWDEFQGSSPRAQAITKLAARASGSLQRQLLDEALAAAQAILDEDLRVTLACALSDSDHSQVDLIRRVAQLEGDSHKARALGAISGELGSLTARE